VKNSTQAMFEILKTPFLNSELNFRKKALKLSKLFYLVIIPFVFSCSHFKNPENETITLHQLQEMADMATVEIVVSRIVKASDEPAWYKHGDRKILMSVRARLKAGVDMSGIKDEHIQISGNNVRMEIPAARLISLNIDPNSINEEYSRTGFFRSSFTSEERYDFLRQAENQIRESIDDMGLLEAAELNAVLFFESWLELMGYESVQVVVRKD
jgi:hypothetical protein